MRGGIYRRMDSPFGLGGPARPTQFPGFKLRLAMVGKVALSLLLLGSVLAPAEETNRPAFRLGIDVLADGGFRELKGKRVGLVTNPSGVDGKGVPSWKRFRESSEVNLVALGLATLLLRKRRCRI